MIPSWPGLQPLGLCLCSLLWRDFHSCYRHQAPDLSLLIYSSLLVFGYTQPSSRWTPLTPEVLSPNQVLGSQCHIVYLLSNSLDQKLCFSWCFPWSRQPGDGPRNDLPGIHSSQGTVPTLVLGLLHLGRKKRGGGRNRRLRGLDCSAAWSQPRPETAPPPRESRLSASKNSLCLWANVPEWGLSRQWGQWRRQG